MLLNISLSFLIRQAVFEITTFADQKAMDNRLYSRDVERPNFSCSLVQKSPHAAKIKTSCRGLLFTHPVHVPWMVVTGVGEQCPRADVLHQPGGCSVQCLDDSQCSSDERCCLTSCGGYSCIPAHQRPGLASLFCLSSQSSDSKQHFHLISSSLHLSFVG